jgi:hypothetical protein
LIKRSIPPQQPQNQEKCPFARSRPEGPDYCALEEGLVCKDENGCFAAALVIKKVKVTAC